MQRLNEALTEGYLRMRSYLDDEEGQGLIEYGLIIALIAIVVIVLLSTIGSSLNSQFSKIASAVQ